MDEEDDRARTHRQLRMMAMTKPLMKMAMNWTLMTTCSAGGREGQPRGSESSRRVREEETAHLLRDALLNQVRVGLDAGRDGACADSVKVGDVLAHDGAQVPLADAASRRLARVDPGEHVDPGRDDCECGEVWSERSGSRTS